MEYINDLIATLNIQNIEWNDWERDFIEDLDGKEWQHMSPRQQVKIKELWEKI